MQDNPSRLLIVEDDPELRESFSDSLAKDFAISFAEDALSCLQVARRESVSAILLDLDLNQSAGDSFSVLDILSETPDLMDVPVVVLASASGARLETECQRRGARRFLTKPVSQRAILDALNSALVTRPSRTRVLVVDDDPDVCRAIQRVLRNRAYDVSTAQDGATALMIARKRPPEVVLLDLGLPGAGGHSVLQRMKASPELSGIPVIVMTGQSPAEHRRTCYAEGAFGFITKPASTAEILAALEEARCAI